VQIRSAQTTYAPMVDPDRGTEVKTGSHVLLPLGR
jgi:hypothetical protein